MSPWLLLYLIPVGLFILLVCAAPRPQIVPMDPEEEARWLRSVSPGLSDAEIDDLVNLPR